MMKSPQDKMLDIPAFQQQGVQLILKVLRESKGPVDILSFGSARPIAVAYNRDPVLFRSKVRRIHLCAGSTSPDYLEWDVGLDPNAIVCLLRSDLPVAIYPCAVGTKEGGPFGYGPHNTFYKTPNLQFFKQMDPKLQRYMAYAFGRVNRSDFLRAMDEDFPDELTAKVYSQPHNVWETSVWAQVSNRRLVRHADGHVPASSCWTCRCPRTPKVILPLIWPPSGRMSRVWPKRSANCRKVRRKPPALASPRPSETP